MGALWELQKPINIASDKNDGHINDKQYCGLKNGKLQTDILL